MRRAKALTSTSLIGYITTKRNPTKLLGLTYKGSLSRRATEAHSDGSAEIEIVGNTFYHILKGSMNGGRN